MPKNSGRGEPSSGLANQVLLVHYQSAVKKSVQREVKFPATGVMMTALQFVYPSRATGSLSSGTCPTPRSASRLLPSKASMIADRN